MKKIFIIAAIALLSVACGKASKNGEEQNAEGVKTECCEKACAGDSVKCCKHHEGCCMKHEGCQKHEGEACGHHEGCCKHEGEGCNHHEGCNHENEE